MSQRFTDKVVFITGASGGIGEAVALAFAREGARVVLSARRFEALTRVQEACGGPARAAVVPLDQSDLASLPARAEEVLAAFGRIDIVVHNAGISQRSRAIETSVAVDEQLMRTNYLGPVALTKALLPAMIRQGGGRFVVVTSLVGVIGSPLRSGYAASKHALHGFFDSLRAELHDEHIGVTLVCPGFVRTEVSENALRGDGSRNAKLDEATARGISPEACASALLDAVAYGREEVYVGGFERAGVYLKRFAPRVFSQFLRRAKVT